MKVLKKATPVPKKEKAYFVDTNIFLRALINDDDKTYTDVLTFLEGIKNNRFKAYSSSLVLAEVVWTLSSFYKLGKVDVVKSLESIINLNGLMFAENLDGTKALDLYKTHNVKYIDCLICSGLNKTKKAWTIVSYDVDFDKLGVKRVEPKALYDK